MDRGKAQDEEKGGAGPGACNRTAAAHEIRHILVVERDILHRPKGRVDVLKTQMTTASSDDSGVTES